MGQLSPDDEEQCQSCQARQQQCAADAKFHGSRSNPAFGASTWRTQTIFTVGAFLKVEKVIDEICGNLHAAGEEGAQQGGQGLELPIAESQGTTQQYGDDGSRQGLGTGGEKPGIR